MRSIILLIFLASLMSCEPSLTPLDEFRPLQISQDRVNDSDQKGKPYLIMVSLDGFRHDYAEKYGAANLLQMAAKGFSLEQLIPSFPTKTFPNHYSLVTGMYPSSHGLVSNSFFNPIKGDHYKINKRTVVRDGSWYGGTPLWVLAEQQGMLSASFFWVGTEADIQNTYPSYYFNYDGDIPNDIRVDQALDWLSLPESQRPHLITLYFSLTDDIGHRYGPESEEIRTAVKEIDTTIGRIRKGIAQMDLPVNLIVSSDHGMVEVSEVINLDSIDFRSSEISWSMPFMVYEKDTSETERIYNELKQIPELTVYRKNEIPASLNYVDHPNIGEIIALTQPPYVISQGSTISPGTHGFDPESVPEMNTIFYAEGPNIQPGKLPIARNIDVFPLVVELLGLEMPTHPIDGSNTIRDAALK